MKQLVVALLLIASLGCVRRPAPVASDTASGPPEERMAIAVEYVAVPTMTVYKQPTVEAQVAGSYGLYEAISILGRNGDWIEIRTTDSVGWVKATDLMTAEKKKELEANPMPRFYAAPAVVPAGYSRGEIVFQAKVNTDGAVVDVQTVRNTTGNMKLAEANAEALRIAKFYPMVNQGRRQTFVYEHKVYY